MKRAFFLCVMFVMISFMTGVVAQETVPIAAPVVEQAPKIVDLIGLDNILKIVSLIVLVIVMGGLAFFGWKFRNNQAVHDAIEALRVGVDKSQADFVEWRKRAAADGKLTREEIKEAERIALEHAKEIAKGPALELLKNWGTSIISSYIARIIEKKKNPAATPVK